MIVHLKQEKWQKSSLKNHRADACFKKFWDETVSKDLGVDEPVLRRSKRAPVRFDDRTFNTHNEDSVENLYCKYCFEILDTLVGEVEHLPCTAKLNIFFKKLLVENIFQ